MERTLGGHSLAMTALAAAVGTLEVAGRHVPRFGFGTMRLTGRNIIGEPADRDQAVAVVRAAYDAGVRLFDTAWYYGPDTASTIVREALHPYAADVVLVSKLGGARDETGGWIDGSAPDQLYAGAERECRLLGVDSLPVVHLRVMPHGAPLEDMLPTFRQMHDDGLIGAIGLSTVDRAQLDLVLDAGVEVATVSNQFGPGSRDDQAVLDRCEELAIPFLPYFSLITARKATTLHGVAQELGITTQQVALAWLLQHSPVLLPIPGTSKLAHLAENIAATAVALSPEQVTAIG